MNKKATASTIRMCIMVVLALAGLTKTVFARRANPTQANASWEMYCVDSDDDLGLAPTYNFVDTAYGTWTRVTGFTNNDDGYAILPAVTPNLKMVWYQLNRGIPIGTFASTGEVNSCYVSTNGTIGLDTQGGAYFDSPTNSALPTVGQFKSVVAPLWADFELRTTGDSSKVFIRAVTDSLYITYYNLSLKGTNGKIRATFQVVFTDLDTSVTFNYKSFDGSLNGVSAAQIFQSKVTIGVENNQSIYACNYLDRGIYYAQSYGTSANALPLHSQLAVKFLARVQNQVRVKSINNPSSNGYEISGYTFYPAVTVENLTGTKDTMSIHVTIVNLLTGSTVYSRYDTTLYVNANSTLQWTSTSLFTALNCGYYKLTAYVDVPAHPDDAWVADNYMSRTFYYFQNQTSYPFLEDFTYGLNACAWETYGAQVARGDSVMRIPLAPRDGESGALVLDRLDYFGNPYSPLLATTGDTIISSPINLAGKGSVYLSFVYQRGLKTDSLQAGITNRVLSGPERTVLNASGTVIQQGDTLLVEGLDSTASALNPLATGWITIAALDGGLDVAPNLYRTLLPARFVGSHFRLRFRLLGHNNAAADYSLPVDDNDSWVVDGVQLANSINHNDLEPVDISFGSSDFTHIPRNVGVIYPQVRIRNNGIGNTAAQNLLVSISDQLGRIVYWRKQTFYFDGTRSDTLISLPGWNILGSQGGVFSAYVSIQNNSFDYDHMNDTNTFVKSLFIDDVYALDDNKPDSAGSMQNAQNNFYYLFTPLASDSLRGCDLYMMNAAGSTMSWTVAIQDYGTDTTTFATRGISYSSTAGGWLRSNFSPVYLAGGKPYRLHFTETSGSGILGGDASKAMQFYTVKDPSNSAYGVEFPSVDSLFQNSGELYYPAIASTNIAGGGLLLPMVRLEFQGSSTYLPVELVSFSGMRAPDGTATLNWKTAKEDGVLTYTVERQAPAGWVRVASNGATGGNNGANYSATDLATPPTQVVYRLSETDLDGATRHLATTTLAAFGATASPLLTAYPNPASEHVHVSMNAVPIDQLIVRDVLGRAVFKLDSNQAGRSELELDFSSLPSGAYYIQAQAASRWFTQHITIQR